MTQLNYVKIGRYIADLRRKHGYKQVVLAQKLHVADKTLSKWETGEGVPDLESLFNLSIIFNKSVDEIIKVGINDDHVRIIMLIDKSDDLFELRHDIIENFNLFLNKQKEIFEETKMSILLFDSSLYTYQPTTTMKNVQLLHRDLYRPSGRRALYDAVGKTIDHYIKNSNLNEKKLMIIFSGGADINSKNFTQEDVVNKIMDIKDNNWDFIYINPYNNRELGEGILNYGENDNIKTIFEIINEWVLSYRFTGKVPLNWHKLTKTKHEIKLCEVCGMPIFESLNLKDKHMKCYYKL